MDDAATIFATEPTDTAKTYDIVIIGAGASGATLAQALAKTGKSILILERGEYLPIEADNWNPKEVFIKHRYRTHEKWVDRKGKDFIPNTHYWVGGNTIFYGAALYRFRRRDFERTDHYGGGVSPAWPISYDDLSDYYTQAEQLWGVHGIRGEDPTGDATAPAYPHPPLKDDPEITKLKGKLSGLGLTPFSMPMAVDRDEADTRDSPCIRCKTCGGFPCLREAKNDGRKMVEYATTHPNVALLAGAKVTRLDTDSTGAQITGVQYEKDGERYTAKGDLIILAAGAVNSAALLLASANDKHPNGLANGSDQVGRNYMFHTSTASMSFAPPKIETTFPKTIALNDYYWGDPDGGFDYPMGHIQMLEYLSPDVIRGQLARNVPAWLIPNFLTSYLSERILPFLVMTEDLPEARNRVQLTPEGQIKINYWHNNLHAHKRLISKFHAAMSKAGRRCQCFRGYRAQMDAIIPLYGTAHQCGTLRMGNDPKNSVVDASCKSHEIDNLYVADTSVFVSSAAVNPALTAIANSLRIADLINAA